MQKRFFALILAFVLAFGTAAAETRIMAVTDLHYFAKEYYEGSDLFARSLAAGDGKVTQYSDELLDALVAEALHQQPDVLALTGDLSFNGEAESHRGLARALDTLAAAGITVCVIPGNHDIANGSARAFEGDTTRNLTQVTPALFRKIYAAYLPNVPEDNSIGMSYVVHASEKVWLCMLDVCLYEDGTESFGLFTKDQLAWLEDVMAQAEAAQAVVITATHQSMLPQTEWMQGDYGIMGGDALAACLRAHGMHLNLSGHIHAQHIKQEDGVADAATGAFSVSPHLYAMVTVGDDGSVAYEARPVCAEHLPDGFTEMTGAYFMDATRNKLAGQLGSLPVTEEQRNAMIDYAAQLNLAYFSGTYQSDVSHWQDDPARVLWQTYGSDVRFGQYLENVLAEGTGDMRHVSFGGDS